MSLDTNQVILVDQNDQAIGTCDKLVAHQEGLCHRAFSIFVYRYHQGQLECLLQQRHPEKYHSGGLWTNSCCGHPAPEEEITAAAERRLHEELGVHLGLQAIGQFHYHALLPNQLIENEFDHVYMGELTHQNLRPHPQEITHVAWQTPEAITQQLTEQPEIFTAWFADAWDTCCQAIAKQLPH